MDNPVQIASVKNLLTSIRKKYPLYAERALQVDDEFAVVIIEETLKALEVLKESQNILTDNECYCGKYKFGDLLPPECSDGGCMYPGA